MSADRATREDHKREIARLQSLIKRIHEHAEALQKAAQKLPAREGSAVNQKASNLIERADTLRDEVQDLKNGA